MSHVGAGLLVAVLVVGTVAGLVVRNRSGRVARRSARVADQPSIDPVLGRSLGIPADGITLLQFSSAFCAPCRATRQLLAHLADTLDGVHHVEVDAESHLDVVRELAILRTPTTILLRSGQHIVGRISGLPRKDELIRAISPQNGTEVPEAGSDIATKPGRVRP